MMQKTMLLTARSAARAVQSAAIMIAMVSSVHAQAPTGAPIRLGLIAELSGPLAFYGSETNRAAVVMAKEINGSGGLLGRPVELISRDSKGTVTEAVRQARDLLLTENVDFLLHSINSAECVAVSSVAKQAQKILISNCANDDFTGKDGNNYAFRIVNITTRTQGYAGAEYIHKNLMGRGNRYFTIAHDFAFGRLSVGYFKERMKALNPMAEFIGEAWPKLNESDYTSFITALIEAKPDVVFFSWAIGLPFWQQSAAFEITKKFAMVSSYWGGSDELQLLTKAEIPTGAVMGGFPYYAIDSAANSGLVDEFKKANGKPPRTPAYFEFVSLQALKTAVEKAGSTETDKVVKSLSGLQFDSVVGPVTVRAFDHQGTTPHWTGKAAWDEKRNLGVLTDIIKLPTSEFLPTEAEIGKVRPH
jgi:branched-chain amino acid transport system substrate-binding protein